MDTDTAVIAPVVVYIAGASLAWLITGARDANLGRRFGTRPRYSAAFRALLWPWYLWALFRDPERTDL